MTSEWKMKESIEDTKVILEEELEGAKWEIIKIIIGEID